jgi:GNAT superfamily N-acetyltransferase
MPRYLDTSFFKIREAEPADAPAIAYIHLTARREAMPYLHRPHTDDETRDYFGRVVGHRPSAWWVAQVRDKIVGYMLIDGENLDHLYVRPGWQRRGIGLSLLAYAKRLSPRRLELWTFQRNSNARAFYEAQDFHAVDCTDGRNEENEPDVKYEWRSAWEHMNAKVRRARPADIARIMTIRHAVRENRLSDPNSVTAADCAAFIERSEIWVWEEDGLIIGFAAGDTRDGWVWALFVDPNYEGRGIGRVLLMRACSTLRAAGYPLATLSTGEGTRAERFYRGRDWTATGRNHKGEIVFEKRLA